MTPTGSLSRTATVSRSEKPCIRCGVVKPLADFYAHPRMADGRLGKCKECSKRYARDDRKLSPEKHRAYAAKHRNTPNRLAQRKVYRARELAKWPERQAARKKVANAIRSGALTRQPCARCGSTERIHGHHHDYLRPLDVVWLCEPHHREEHAVIAKATDQTKEKP